MLKQFLFLSLALLPLASQAECPKIDGEFFRKIDANVSVNSWRLRLESRRECHFLGVSAPTCLVGDDTFHHVQGPDGSGMIKVTCGADRIQLVGQKDGTNERLVLDLILLPNGNLQEISSDDPQMNGVFERH